MRMRKKGLDVIRVLTGCHDLSDGQEQEGDDLKEMHL